MTTAEIPTNCPAHVPPDRVRVFDYTRDPVADGSPIDGYLAFRGEPPFWSPVAGGFWVLTDAESIRKCFQDPYTFSNKNIGLGYTSHERVMIPEQLDPPEHGKYRRLLSPYFTPAAASAIEDDVRRICIEAIEEFVDEGQCDLVARFTGRYPQIVFLKDVLHLPVERMDTFLAWEHDMMRHPRDGDAVAASSKALLSYLGETIAERAAHPMTDDLLSDLLQTTVDGRPTTQDEVLNMAFLLFAAGLDTVTSALSFSFHYLAQHADKRHRLATDPDIIPSAIEELLRYHSFVSSVRTATRDVEFQGITLKEGDRVLPVSVLAARDPEEFEDPDEVIFERPVNRHIAFGAGPHRCLGSHLARLEMKVAFEEFHRLIPDYELVPGEAVRFHAAGTMGVDNLPIRWPSRSET